MRIRHLLAVTCLAAFAPAALPQGALAPTSGPAPCMRSLDQIEPRTPIGAVGGSASGITLSAPGSYVLMGNVTVNNGESAITVLADQVTIDLNGFTLSSTDQSSNNSGVSFGTVVQHASIRNGRILGRGFLDGVVVRHPSAAITIAQLVVNGVRRNGIDAGTSFVAECAVTNCPSDNVAGASAIKGGRIVDCTVEACSERGISGGTVENCRARVTNDVAIQAENLVSGCSAYSQKNWGIVATRGTVINSTGVSDELTGILARTVTASTGSTSATGAYGIQAIGTASYCHGANVQMSAVAIYAKTAVGCTAAKGIVQATTTYPN